MPKRSSLRFGVSTSPHQSTSTVNEAVSALSTKLNSSRIEHSSLTAPIQRRPSFSMDSIFHHAKDKNKRNDSKDRESGRKDKHLSMSLRGSSSKDRASRESPHLGPVLPAKLTNVIESPPLIFFGSTSASTGALLSGRLRLGITDPTGEVRLNKFTMRLRALIATKKPVQKDCIECKERFDDLHKWTFLSEPKTFHKEDDNQFPFSFLLPGHLPATTSSTLGSISYFLAATATTSNSETIELFHPLIIQRAITPGPDKTSIRIFPPTNLAGRVILPSVIHPIGLFPVQMTLSGIVEKKTETQIRWRLRKITWRIEEDTTMVSTACAKHGHKIGGEGKGVQNKDNKILGSDELKHGWKTDFDAAGGEILLEFDAAITSNTQRKPVCNVDSPAGLEVKHNLIIELIVAEEWCSNKRTDYITPTGAARVLRMQFALIVTERAGMGISWDEEMPPTYDDVPASPPGYGNADPNDGAFGGAIMEDYSGPELEYVELERMHSENPNDPPVYRERNPMELRNMPVRSPALRPYLPRARAGTESSDHSIDRSRVFRWSEDDIGAEPPQYALRGRQDSGAQEEETVEDVGEGEAAPTVGGRA